MENGQIPKFNVSDFIAALNQTLEFAYPAVMIEGEVANLKVSQGKWVFFDLKDESGSLGCFMTSYQMRMPLEDGMKIVARVYPKITNWGKFSVTVQAYRLAGEGSLRKGFELLKQKLEKEGLFAEDRKRSLPKIPKHIAVISSTQAAGYVDFMKIVNDRWSGLKIDVAHTQVQGDAAADQIISAIKYFNQQAKAPEVIVIVRGGGSVDDLSAFNDEPLVREIAASRIPTLVGVGHEIDTTLADLAADVRAATPSNAAQIIVPDRREIIANAHHLLLRAASATESALDDMIDEIDQLRLSVLDLLDDRVESAQNELAQFNRVLAAYNPKDALKRGYAIVRGDENPGSMIWVEKIDKIIEAEVKNVQRK